MIISVDFETYYDREFSLSKMTTEEYVRDDNFEVIGVGVKVDNAETEWFSGTYSETMHFLGKFKWSEAFVLAHNMMFDGAILSWKFGIKPMAWLDTLCMARATDGLLAAYPDIRLACHLSIPVDQRHEVAVGRARIWIMQQIKHRVIGHLLDILGGVGLHRLRTTHAGLLAIPLTPP